MDIIEISYLLKQMPRRLLQNRTWREGTYWKGARNWEGDAYSKIDKKDNNKKDCYTK